jgi:PIN domain nuclease of toxin-antitoxin system
MRLLLDTHVAIWWLDGDRRLSPATRTAIESSAEAYLSVASLWEIVLKQDKGRIDLPAGFAAALRDDFADLPLTADHVLEWRALPSVHRDPFDRMLVAQALAEGLTIVTADHAIAGFQVSVLPA